jgi:hypothetical protein
MGASCMDAVSTRQGRISMSMIPSAEYSTANRCMSAIESS